MLTKYLIWTDGDPSVGIAGDQAEVTMEVSDEPEAENNVRRALGEVFRAIWDVRHVSVMTEAECQDDRNDSDE